MIFSPLGLHGSQVRFFIAHKMTIVIGGADREQRSIAYTVIN